MSLIKGKVVYEENKFSSQPPIPSNDVDNDALFAPRIRVFPVRGYLKFYARHKKYEWQYADRGAAEEETGGKRPESVVQVGVEETNLADLTNKRRRHDRFNPASLPPTHRLPASLVPPVPTYRLRVTRGCAQGAAGKSALHFKAAMRGPPD